MAVFDVVGIATILALFAALCFGLQAVVVDVGMRRGTAFAAAFVSIVVSMLLFWLLAGIRGIPVDQLLSHRILPFLVAGIGYPALFRLLYFEGIRKVGPSLASAVIAANPAIAAVVAIVALGERMTILSVTGLVLIVGGAGTLQFVQRGGDGDRQATDILLEKLRTADVRDLAYPLAAMVLYGVCSVLIKFGLDGFASTTTATAVTQTSAFVVFLGLLVGSRDATSQVNIPDGRTFAAFAVAGVFVALAWLGQFYALRLGTVVTVIPLVNVYPLIVVAVSYAIARQFPNSPRILGAILAIVAGAVLLQL